MANGLMGLQDLLGQSSNATSGGLMGGASIFSNPPTRNQQRSRLLTDLISNAGQDPYARLGSAFGGLIGMGVRAGAEGLGIVDEPEEVRRNNAIREVQQTVSQEGLDPLDPGFGERVAELFTERNFPDLATRSLLQARQLQSQFAPEPIEPATFYNTETDEYVRGGYRGGVAVDERGQPLGQGFVERDFEAPSQRETFTPLGSEEKQNLGIDPNKFAQRNDLTGRVHTAGGQTINVGDEANPAFDALTDQFKNDLTQASEAATQATGLLEEVNRATDLLSQGDFTTGAVRPILTGLRGIAEDLGVSIDPALREAGVENLSDVSDAEAFAAFSANLTTRLAERLPGNLNQQEINLISSASSQLGKTPEANASALAAFRAGAELAQRNASRLTEAAAQGTQELIAEQRRQRERGTEEFETLSERYKQEILESRRRQTQPQQSGNETQNGQAGRLRYNPQTGRVE